MQYMETSAKNSNNVTELFTAVTGDLVDKNRHKYLADSTLGVIDSSTFIMYFKYDCPKCQTVLPQYRRSAKDKFGVKTALIEMPPYGNINTSVDCLEVKLSDEFEWFVTAPVELRLNDGVVVGVSSENEALALHQANR